MQVIASGKAIANGVGLRQLNCFSRKYRFAVRIMKLTAIILLAACLQLSARGISQTITISLKDVSLLKVFKEIERQTDYTFFYDLQRLQKAKRVTVMANNLPIAQVLEQCFKDQPFSYTIWGKTITIGDKKIKVDKEEKTSLNQPPLIDVKGRVLNSKGEPVSNATVTVQGTRKSTITDVDGNFNLAGIEENAIIIITHIQYEPESITVNGHGIVNATLQIKVNKLDELQVIAYGTTTKRLNTGNVFTIKSTDIEKQPVNNPLLALEGRVPGLLITQQTGLPGGEVTVRIQGQNSLSRGNEPLYVIDGVPFTQSTIPNVGSSLFVSGNGNGSPLSFINPSDIESINILKDADATSIYGSRAAAGAILITTKRGKPGRIKVDVNAQTGWGKVAKFVPLLNTSEYLQMRHQAKQNDGASILSSDYDINGTWDTTRYTDWQKELIGKTAKYNDVQYSMSGGNSNTTFSIGGGYHKETTVFPGNLSDQKGSVRFNINSVTNNQKFSTQLTGFYLVDNNHLIANDLTQWAIKLSPNAPALYNSDGSLNWAQLSNGNSTWYNPLALLTKKYKNKTSNLIANAVIGYEPLKGLRIQASLGYTNLTTDENQINPSTANAPERKSITPMSSIFGNSKISSWIIEPQLTYKTNILRGKFEILFGSTFLSENRNSLTMRGSNYSTDVLLQDIASAGSIEIQNTYASNYRYNAIFSRVNYNWENKYILDLTARRDGSSRFGAENLFSNFGSIGGAWVFSSEHLAQKIIPFLSFGKLRASYGTTGNDQIGDYQFMNLYNSLNVSAPYGGGTALLPGPTPPNAHLQWEKTKKLEIGIDVGVSKDRFLLSANYYYNRSSNQLQPYALPYFTGRSTLQVNMPATIQNNGCEISLNSSIIQRQTFKWNLNINLTIPKNKIVAYPGLENSSYASLYVVGQPISIVKVTHLLGVNSTKGLYEVEDEKGQPTSSPISDDAKTVLINLSPKYYGGIENSFHYQGFDLDFLFQFTKEIAPNYLFGNRPGAFSSRSISILGINNQPIWVLGAWQKNGDNSSVQKYSSTYPSSISDAYNNARFSSDASYSDASFVRLKNISIAWNFPNRLIRRMRIQNAKLFALGQNIITITNYKGLDPETISVSTLPPLRVVTIGFQVTL